MKIKFNNSASHLIFNNTHLTILHYARLDPINPYNMYPIFTGEKHNYTINIIITILKFKCMFYTFLYIIIQRLQCCIIHSSVLKIRYFSLLLFWCDNQQCSYTATNTGMGIRGSLVCIYYPTYDQNMSADLYIWA